MWRLFFMKMYDRAKRKDFTQDTAACVQCQQWLRPWALPKPNQEILVP